MNVRNCLLGLILLPILLGGCASAPPAFAPTAAIVRPESTATARRAEIVKQIARVCPVTLTAAELDRAASLVERLSRDVDVVALVRRLDRFDLETRICRGEKASAA